MSRRSAICNYKFSNPISTLSWRRNPEFREIDMHLSYQGRPQAEFWWKEKKQARLLEQGHWEPLLVHAEGFAGGKNNVQLSLYPSEALSASWSITARGREVRKTEELECTKGPSSQMHTRGERNRLGKIWRMPQEIKVSSRDEMPSLDVRTIELVWDIDAMARRRPFN